MFKRQVFLWSILISNYFSQANANETKENVIRKTFYFIRHGTTSYNLERICQGQADISLHEIGRAEARRVSLKNTGITHIFYSPLSRTFETTQIISQEFDCPKMAIADLKERHFGEFENKKWPFSKEEFAKTHKTFEPNFGEKWSQFFNRVINGINFGLANSDCPLFVGHSGTFQAIMPALGLEYKSANNCELIKFIPNIDDQGWTVTKDIVC